MSAWASGTEARDAPRLSAASAPTRTPGTLEEMKKDLRNSRDAKKLLLTRSPLTYSLFQLRRMRFAHSVYSASSKMPPNGIRGVLHAPALGPAFCVWRHQSCQPMYCWRISHFTSRYLGLRGSRNSPIGLKLSVASPAIGQEGAKRWGPQVLVSIPFPPLQNWQYGSVSSF